MGGFYRVHEGPGPRVAVALHGGHDVRPGLARHLSIPKATRIREEDPFTDRWTEIAPTRVTVLRSRFEVDLNRPRDEAVYAGPEHAWGLQPWSAELPEGERRASLDLYDAFYDAMEDLLDRKSARGRFVVYDLHSYNRRRGGPDGPVAPAAENPDVNLGTGSMNPRWRPVADAFLRSLSEHDFPGRCLDVRENVRFRGGHFPDWVHERYGDRGCVLAVEVKKFFMDEWTGLARRSSLEAVQEALAATGDAVESALEAVP